MKRVNYCFSTKLTFDDYVHDHSFALRIIPPETASQQILSCNLNISPYVPVKQTVDAFGNNVTTGYLRDDHRFLDFEIKGTAEVDCTKRRTDYMPCYQNIHSLTMLCATFTVRIRTAVSELPQTGRHISAMSCRRRSDIRRA